MKPLHLARRMSIQDAREASLRGRGPKNKFERGVLDDVPKAVKRVEEFYGIKIKELPHVLVSHRHIFPDGKAMEGYVEELQKMGRISYVGISFSKKWAKRQEAIRFLEKVYSFMDYPEHSLLHLKLFLRPTGYYYAPLESIQVPPKHSYRHLQSPLDLLSHELVHHAIWEKRSPLYYSMFSRNGREDMRLALDCAHEGLATYVESWAHKEPEKGVSKWIKRELSAWAEIGRRTIGRILYPQRALAELAEGLSFFASNTARYAAIVCRGLLWGTPEKLAKAIEKSAFARMAINKYSDGREFVKEVSKELGGPREAFKAITERPPQSMQEILNPKKYLVRLETGDPTQD